MKKEQEYQELCCEVCGLTKSESQYVRYIKEFDKVLCNKHFLHLKRYGKIMERTTKDKNEFILCDDHAEICLYDVHNVECGRALIDLEDVERCRPLKWRLSQSKSRGRYVCSYKEGKFFSLHVFLLGTKEGLVIDHINRNGLDNRKCNLRFVKTAENAQNNWGKHITFNKRKNAYAVEITRYGISYRKAGFKTIEEATRYRDELMAELDCKNEELKRNFEKLGEKLSHAVFCGHGWRAEVCENGRSKMLGTFRTKEEAHKHAMDYLRKRDGITDEKT